MLSSGCHGLFNKETDLDKHTRSDADAPQSQTGSGQQLPRAASLRKRSSKTLQNSNFVDLLFTADPVSLLFSADPAGLPEGMENRVCGPASAVTPALWGGPALGSDFPENLNLPDCCSRQIR